MEECYELSEDKSKTFHEPGGLKILASQMCTLPDGSHKVELAIKIVLFILAQDSNANTYQPELSMAVVALARQFALLQNQLKFDILRLFSDIFSSKSSQQLQDSLRMISNDTWPHYIRVGVIDILQNRVAPSEKLRAFILADSMLSILGERWLIGQSNLPDLPVTMSADRCLLLVLESSRVEVAVLLNELAYLKYEATKDTSSTAEAILVKKRSVATAFSLVEKIVKLVSTMAGSEGELIGESTFIKVINGLNETLNVVLEYLQDAKEHGQKKGDDLLASVRVIGSYLAETPNACKGKVSELLGYMLSIEAEDEPSPFYSICFLLPMLCQITMEIDGCKVLVSCGGYKAIAEFLIKVIGPSHYTTENYNCIFLACDTIMNLLLKRGQISFSMDESTIVALLTALAYWTENADNISDLVMASSICALIFDSTSEQSLLSHPNFSSGSLDGLSRLIARSLYLKKDMSDAAKSEMDLLDIVSSGFSRWSHRFPRVRNAVESMS